MASIVLLGIFVVSPGTLEAWVYCPPRGKELLYVSNGLFAPLRVMRLGNLSFATLFSLVSLSTDRPGKELASRPFWV
ncbi:hypothetical protein SUGI_0712320 [Cryptomeria japonica]|nr:hypothetical protein SUGI_0712320 [Cryptomeria japonica]